MTEPFDIPETRRARVLLSFPKPVPESNPYVVLLAQLISPSVDVTFFSWRAAFLSRYDVLHVQWPEALVRPYTRSRLAPVAGTVKLLLAFALLLRTRIFGAELVWTVHNLTPHERGNALERAFISLFLRCVDHRIFLNRGELDDLGRPSSVILHPDYAPVVQPGLVGTSEEHASGPVLFFGRLVAYKGVESLIDTMIANPLLGDLLVTGGATDAAYGEELIARAAGFEHVTISIGHVDQVELERTIARARLVVLPYHYVYNSGALLLAMTLHTAVLVRASETTRAFREEMGADWVTLFDEQLTSEDLGAALDNANRAIAGPGPDLSRRTWAECAERHVELYRSLSTKGGISL